MKKSVLILSFLVISLLAVTIVSAFWPFSSGITGNVVADNTAKPDGTKCQDSDGGVFASQEGFVLKIGTFGNTVYSDACSGTRLTFYTASGRSQIGYSQITENYCEGNTRRFQVMNSTNLGDGYCIAATITEDEKKISSAKWAPLPAVCTNLGSGSVKDQTGTAFRKGCYGTDSKTFKSYSCSADNKTVVTTQQVCNVRCDATRGCVGSCTAAIDGRSVTFDGQVSKNTCLSSRTIRKYSCQEGGYLSVATENCGTSQECVEDTNSAGYCREVIAGTATIASLQQQIAALTSQIANLISRIEALEGV